MVKTNGEAEREARLKHALEWLERDVWPFTAGMKVLSKEDEEEPNSAGTSSGMFTNDEAPVTSGR